MAAEIIRKLERYLLEDAELKRLLEQAIAQAAETVSDPFYNPSRDLSSFLNFLERGLTSLPWEVLDPEHVQLPNLFWRIDQAIGAFYFVFDQPLKELEGKGYFFPCLEYHEPMASWLNEYIARWGLFLDGADSWKEDYAQLLAAEEKFGLHTGEYEDSRNWHSFNEFFTRRLSSVSMRPIAESELVSPADAVPQGIWGIDENGTILAEDGVLIKTKKYCSIRDLLGRDSAYIHAFDGGTMTHTFLNLHNYHRYHFPVGGTIKELYKINGFSAPGGVIRFDPEKKIYYTEDYNTVGWQSLEVRGCIILETAFGPVAVLPIGMCQVASVNFRENLKPGMKVEKGEEMGFFRFGGSDIVILLPKDVEVRMLVEQENGEYPELRTGAPYACLSAAERR